MPGFHMPSRSGVSTSAPLLLSTFSPVLTKAFQMKLAFQDFWGLSRTEAPRFLDAWCDWVQSGPLEPMVRFVQTVEGHRNGILRWFKTRISNGLLEGLSSLVQVAKTRARGYRSTRNLIAMIYLIHGKLPLHQPI